MALTPYTPKFKAAIMKKPQAAKYLSSKPSHVQEALLQKMFTEGLIKTLVKISYDGKR